MSIPTFRPANPGVRHAVQRPKPPHEYFWGRGAVATVPLRSKRTVDRLSSLNADV